MTYNSLAGDLEFPWTA